ncbi:MAG: FAD-binding oxidoreductase [Hyphomicrobiales bacterium]|nr:FAD-binding oxidoreductase [Hyphomicrobiales bacterium]
MTDKLADGVVAALLAELGADAVKIGAAIPDRNQQDATKVAATRPLALVLPRNTEQVSAALRICHAHGQPVAPQGGMTGLAGGAHPGQGEIALSLERMSGIEEIDADAGTLTALAGTPLLLIQNAAEEAGLQCGIDLGARGSCTIGGNVATNAGGNQVIRYGMTRRNVLGLEVVLPNGQIVRSLNKMLKNNAGYDWTQLFIGSEGTLGVVTRVVIGLHPKPAAIASAIVAVASVDGAIRLLRAAGRDLPGGLLVFEAMWADFIQVAVERFGLPKPFETAHSLLVLLETPTDGTAAGQDAFESFLADQIDAGIASDAIVAQSGQDRARFWSYRESPYEYARILPPGGNFDISFPIGKIDQAVTTIKADISARWPDMVHVFFGHLADSNLHLIASRPGMDAATKSAVEELVYHHVARFNGSVSAEHGIGRAKKFYLPLTRSAPELELMRTIKAALDPAGILNPGRVF